MLPDLVTGEGLGAPGGLSANLLKLIREHSPHASPGEAGAEEKPRVLARLEHDGASYVLVKIPAVWKLTGRQRSIAALIAEGLPNKDIAHRLGISPATVASHLGRIYRKVHVDSRVALASQANWLLGADPPPNEGANS